jgi:hypothetical protein
VRVGSIKLSMKPTSYGISAGGEYMPLFGMCASSEHPAAAGPVTGMGKAAGSWTAREPMAITVMVRWHPRILQRTHGKRRDVCAALLSSVFRG